MKVGDLVKVRYRHDRRWYTLLLLEEVKLSSIMWKGWCSETGSEHLFSPRRDEVEILNESR